MKTALVITFATGVQLYKMLQRNGPTKGVAAFVAANIT